MGIFFLWVWDGMGLRNHSRVTISCRCWEISMHKVHLKRTARSPFADDVKLPDVRSQPSTHDHVSVCDNLLYMLKLMPIEMHWRNKNNPNKNTDKPLVFLDLSCHEVSAFIFNASSRKKDYISCLSINKYCLLIMACFKFNCMNSKLTIKQWRWGLQYGLENRFQVASD